MTSLHKFESYSNFSLLNVTKPVLILSTGSKGTVASGVASWAVIWWILAAATGSNSPFSLSNNLTSSFCFKSCQITIKYIRLQNCEIVNVNFIFWKEKKDVLWMLNSNLTYMRSFLSAAIASSYDSFPMSSVCKFQWMLKSIEPYQIYTSINKPNSFSYICWRVYMNPTFTNKLTF